MPPSTSAVARLGRVAGVRGSGEPAWGGDPRRLGGGADQGDGGAVQILACRCTVDTKPGADQRFIDRITHMGQGDGAHFTQLIRG